MIREWNRARCKVQRNEWKQQHNYFLFKIEILSIIFFCYTIHTIRDTTLRLLGGRDFDGWQEKSATITTNISFWNTKKTASFESFAMNDDELTASNRQKYKIIILMNYLHICSCHQWKVHDTRRDIFYFFLSFFSSLFFLFRRSFTIFKFLYNTPLLSQPQLESIQ